MKLRIKKLKGEEAKTWYDKHLTTGMVSDTLNALKRPLESDFEPLLDDDDVYLT